jgi:hypothetical protein
VECSQLDLCESEKQKHFLNQTCNCERLYNKVPCSKIVDNEVLIDYRLRRNIANFFNRVLSLDETNDEGKSGNGDRRIFDLLY